MSDNAPYARRGITLFLKLACFTRQTDRQKDRQTDCNAAS